MHYREVMEPYAKGSLLNEEVSIEEALTTMSENKLDVLVITSLDGKVSGVLTLDDAIKAYRKGIPVCNQVKNIMGNQFFVVEESDEVISSVFGKTPLIVVTDKEGAVTGLLTPRNIWKGVLGLSVEKIKKDEEGQPPHFGDWGTIGRDHGHKYTEAEFCTDCYDRIANLVHINKELLDIIAYSSDSIYVTDGKGITIYANDSFESMTGVPVSTVLGKSVFQAEREGIYKPSISAVVLREKRQVTLIQRGLNGKDLVVTGTPVFDIDGQIYMVICNTKDIDSLSVLKNYLLSVKPSTAKALDESSKRLNVIYNSEKMSATMKLANKAAQVDSTVMITGESGTGKGLLARYIHENSSRAGHKMIEINCSAIPDQLIESELFGYETGAFTGARKGGKAGIIEMANKGTLFLDEVGDMPVHMQAKLLKVIQDKQVTRVGSVEPVEIDVRIIAATNKDLKALMEKELFRTDLYYRLNVFPINIEPLRERKEDISTLLGYFLPYYNQKHGSNISISKEEENKIINYSWPGNVRELEYFVERLVIVDEGIHDLDRLDMEYNIDEGSTVIKVNRVIPLKEAVDETERQLIQLVLKTSGNSYEVADILGISQASAYRKIKKYTY